MVAYAYLRVSTNHQDVENQRHGILEYANARALAPLKFVCDEASGQMKWQSRSIKGSLFAVNVSRKRFLQALCRIM
jgi:DNA invertase Pin-like site-specific DNA recombinase